MNDEGTTSESQSAAAAARESATAAIVRPRRRPIGSLTLADWRLLAFAAAAQIAIAAALRVIPVAALRRRAQLRTVGRFAAAECDERIVWAILATGRRLGRISTCLVRALAAYLMIDDRRGLVLTIGVRRADGAIGAHAWLARSGRVLIGAAPDDYVPLVEWDGLSA